MRDGRQPADEAEAARPFADHLAEEWMEQRRSSPIAARIAAGLVFLFGIALLGGTFYLAFRMFADPRVGLLPPPAAGQPAPDLGTQALIILGRVGLLLIMTYAGSAIASKGIHLYQATQHPRAE